MILVTGATGTVGQELVKQLKSTGAQFKAGVRDSQSVAGFDAVAFDFNRPETYAGALRSIDKLFLLSPPGLTQREGDIVDAAKSAGVKHLVKLSVWGAETEAFSFARDHRPVEKKIEASGIPYTFLRPNGFMQNFVTNAAPTIKSQGAFYLPAKDSRISLIDVRDIAAVAATALTTDGHHGKAYRLSGPEAISNVEVAEKLSRLIGKKVNYVDLPDADFKKALTGAGVPDGVADAIIDLQHYYISGAAAEITPEVERVTGRKPISFEQFARDYAPAFGVAA